MDTNGAFDRKEEGTVRTVVQIWRFQNVFVLSSETPDTYDTRCRLPDFMRHLNSKHKTCKPLLHIVIEFFILNVFNNNYVYILLHTWNNEEFQHFQS